MKKEQVSKKWEMSVGYKEVKNFRQLFDLLNQSETQEDYRQAYDDAVQRAKELIDNKAKGSWDAEKFERDIILAHPNLSEDFVSALRHCIESYNPPVNIPDKPLW